MNKEKWDHFAPIYNMAMRKDRRAYEQMYALIREKVCGKAVLELATGTGLIGGNVADVARIMGIAGFHAEKKWTEAEYIDFLRTRGWNPEFYRTLKASFPLTYVECVRSV